ncbi:MAG: CBS domain-containing protein [Defluviicoccus sp.]|nr:CBS domain-containing protein [Defluviicoccus sp.]
MLGPIASRFVEEFPADAARILEHADPDSVGEALADMPAASGAALLQAMTPHAAADWLARLPPEEAAALVSRVRTALATPLLLRLDTAARAALLKALPAKSAAPLRLALRFPAGSVGSLLDPDVVTVRADTRIGEAIEIARRAPASLRKYLYVLDESQRLVGVVDARECVLQDAGRLIGAVELLEPVALRARTGLRQASLAEGWDRFDVLPVTDHRGVFLGVVRRKSLFGAISGQGRLAQKQALGELAFDLAELFWGTTSNLVLGRTNDERRD